MGRLAYEERAKLAQNPMGKRLFETMARKKTNLSVAADFASAAQVRLGLACWAAAQRGPGERGIAEDCLPRLCSCKVLELADQIGPHICCLKTHVDQYDTWSAELADKLVELSKKHGARCPLRPVPPPCLCRATEAPHHSFLGMLCPLADITGWMNTVAFVIRSRGHLPGKCPHVTFLGFEGLFLGFKHCQVNS